MKRRRRARALILAGCVAAVVLVGCGYSVRQTPGFSSLAIGRIENNTPEPRLEDILYEELALELSRKGIRVERGAGHALTGSIDRYVLRGLAEREGVNVQFQVQITGNFTLRGPRGEERPIRGSGAFLVTFAGRGPLESVLANRDEAVRRSLRDMAREIVWDIVRTP
jgi:hypothetical protein